jgi:hypothetical protein
MSLTDNTPQKCHLRLIHRKLVAVSTRLLVHNGEMEVMNRLVQQYFERATDARERSNSLTDDLQKSRWHEIANAYRNLAQTCMTNAALMELPSDLPASPNEPQI